MVTAATTAFRPPRDTFRLPVRVLIPQGTRGRAAPSWLFRNGRPQAPALLAATPCQDSSADSSQTCNPAQTTKNFPPARRMRRGGLCQHLPHGRQLRLQFLPDKSAQAGIIRQSHGLRLCGRLGLPPCIRAMLFCSTLRQTVQGGPHLFLRHCVLGTVPLSGIYDKPERPHLVRSPEASPAFLIALNDLQGFACCRHHLDFSGSHLLLCAVVTFGADAPMLRPGIDVHAVRMGETCAGQGRTEGETWDKSADTRKKHVIFSCYLYRVMPGRAV